MKIALVCPYDYSKPGGVRNHVEHLGAELMWRGHEVTIYAPFSNKKDANGNGFFSVGKAVPFPILGSGTVARINLSFWNYPEMKRHFRSERYDIIHVHSPEVPFLGPAAIYCADPNLSTIVATFHSNSMPSVMSSAYAKLASVISKKFHLQEKIDLHLAVAEVAADSIRRHLTVDHFTIIPNGVDTDMFSPEVQPIDLYNDGKINILFVGRLGDNERRKGLEYLVDAFNQFYRKHTNTRLLIAGHGNPDRYTQGIISATDNPDIVLLGGVSAKDLPRWYRRADACCFPAVGGESFGIVLAEAMSSEKPIVFTDIPGYTNVGTGVNGKLQLLRPSEPFKVIGTGVVVKPKDKNALAGGLEALITHKEWWQPMGEKGRQIVVTNFDWHNIVTPQIIGAYQGAIELRNYEKKAA